MDVPVGAALPNREGVLVVAGCEAPNGEVALPVEPKLDVLEAPNAGALALLDGIPPKALVVEPVAPKLGGALALAPNAGGALVLAPNDGGALVLAPNDGGALVLAPNAGGAGLAPKELPLGVVPKIEAPGLVTAGCVTADEPN